MQLSSLNEALIMNDRLFLTNDISWLFEDCPGTWSDACFNAMSENVAVWFEQASIIQYMW